MPRGTKHRANGEGSVFKIQNGSRWRAEATIGYDQHGKRIVATGTGATRSQAIERREANRQKLLVLQGKAPASTLTNRGVRIRKQTVAEYLDIWFRGINPAKVGDATRRAQRSKIDLHINPHIGTIPLVLLNQQHLRTLFYETLPNKVYDPKRPEKRLSGGAVRNVWKPLYKALQQAVDDGLIEKHPMKGVDKPIETVKEVIIDGNRPKQLLEQLDGDLNEAKWLLTFLLGLRISEKLGLTWDCINLEPKQGEPATIDIKQQLARDLSKHGCGNREGSKYPCGKRSAEHCPKRITGKGLYIKPQLKTSEGRRILPLPETLRILLIEHKERWTYLKKGDGLEWINHGPDGDHTVSFPKWEPIKGLENLVFTMPDGKPISHQQENKDWHALCQKFGLEMSRGHLNRHATATILAESGVPPEVAKLILGHSNERMTAYYTHLKSIRHTLEPLQELEKTLMERQSTIAALTADDLDRIEKQLAKDTD
jgi:integrase